MTTKKAVFSAPIKKEAVPPSPREALVAVNAPKSKITPKTVEKQAKASSTGINPLSDKSFSAFLKNLQIITDTSKSKTHTSPSKSVQTHLNHNNEVIKETPKDGNVSTDTPSYFDNPIPTPESRNNTPPSYNLPRDSISQTNVAQNQADHTRNLNKKSQIKHTEVPKSSEIKPPVKPNSAFLKFIIQSRTALMKKNGLSVEEANDKAVRIWRSKSQDIKNKYEMQYSKQKDKYDQKMIRHTERITKMREKEEKIKGGLQFLFFNRQLVIICFLRFEIG